MKPLVVAALAGAALAASASAPAAWADGGGPTGCVGGWHSPAADTLALAVYASPAEGATLASATLSIDGTPVASSPLAAGTPACTQADQPGVPLSFNTRGFRDGVYRVVVTVADTDGTSTTILDEPTEIWNDRPAGSRTATLTIGTSVPAPPETPTGGSSSGGVAGATASSCVHPRLSVVLDQKPLRIRRGVPVLKRGSRYRFRGRLTCVVRDHRVAAPKRTRIDRLDVVGRRTVSKGGALVRGRGRITFIVPALSSRTLIFRFIAPDGRHVDVAIKIRVARR
jgi:hypothetical protein